MARQVQVLLVDDIDDSRAERNVTFSIDGDSYEIDLSQANIDKLYSALEPYVKSARKVRGRRKGTSATKSTGGANKAAMVREWARGQGMQVSERGRVSQEVMEAYEAAH